MIQRRTAKVFASLSVPAISLLMLAAPFTASAYSLGAFKKVAPSIATQVKHDYGDMVNVAALLNDYDENLILSVLVVESEGNTAARSNKGAQGLMQLMPATAKAMGAKDPHEPYQNILAGTKYLKELQRVYKFNQQEALVAYNMGPTKAKRWLTQYSPNDSLYVQKVMHLYTLLSENDHNAAIQNASTTNQIVATGILTKPKLLSAADQEVPLPSTRRAEVVEEE